MLRHTEEHQCGWRGPVDRHLCLWGLHVPPSSHGHDGLRFLVCMEGAPQNEETSPAIALFLFALPIGAQTTINGVTILTGSGVACPTCAIVNVANIFTQTNTFPALTVTNGINGLPLYREHRAIQYRGRELTLSGRVLPEAKTLA